jgi:nicotinate-nucleotide pyrophosphorylase (carboxylating)
MALDKYLHDVVALALAEDIGAGDMTAYLIPETTVITAEVICRQQAVICGQNWFNEVYRQLDPSMTISWSVADGTEVQPSQLLCNLYGAARTLLTGERTALNFLQTLSGTATTTRRLVSQLVGTHTKLLDTRKTLPCLRYAQKYAVRCGGGQNHRLGLFDAYLIKENHILACGSISKAVAIAREQHPDKVIEVEVETLVELREALDSQVDIIMLDNFNLAMIREAVKINNGRSKLEVSGGVTEDSLLAMAEIGVDYISMGAITKHVAAIDLSMRFVR